MTLKKSRGAANTALVVLVQGGEVNKIQIRDFFGNSIRDFFMSELLFFYL